MFGQNKHPEKAQPEPHWLNKKQMAASCGISVQAFDKWGVKPISKIGNSVYFDARSVVDNRLDNERGKQQPELPEDRDESEIEYQTWRLTKARADAQELTNEKERQQVVEAEFATFVLSKIASSVASRLDTVPLNIRRRFPELETKHIEYLTREIAKARNIAAGLDAMIPELLDDYLNRTD
ncbi:DNA-packaging protein [Oceanisphaera sediminis]|uniref:DNA-packaging protein n=1 Tax=Oceanisphaera sediminis TaxID=981381 RepID=A0ABP7DGL4_9GAMM